MTWPAAVENIFIVGIFSWAVFYQGASGWWFLLAFLLINFPAVSKKGSK